MLNINDLKAQNPEIETMNETVFAKARAFNAVINGNDVTAIEKAELDAKNAAAAFNDAATSATYRIWLKAEKPILAALKDSMIMQVAIKVVNGKTGKSVETSNETAMVNLADFDKFAAGVGLTVMEKSSWKGALEEARKVFCGSCAMETQDESEVKKFIKTFDETFLFAYTGVQADCGEAKEAQRYSTNSCVRTLQYLVDCIIFDDETGEGKNKYRALRSDVNVIRLTISKRGRSLHNISYPNSASFLKNVTDTLIRIVTNEKYTCDYTTAK